MLEENVQVLSAGSFGATEDQKTLFLLVKDVLYSQMTLLHTYCGLNTGATCSSET